MPSTKFQTEPQITEYDSTQSAPHTRGFEFPDVLPLLETVFLGLHFRDHLTENEQARLIRLAPPAAYILMMLGDRVLLPRELPSPVLESLYPTVLQGSDAVFTHLCQIHDHDLACGVVHAARIGVVGKCDVLLGICQSDHYGERHLQVERFGRLVSTARTAFKTASEAATALKPRLADNNPHLLVNRASGRVITAGEIICQELGSDAERLPDIEFSQMSARLQNLFRTRITRMENITVGDMNLAVITFLPERRRTTESDYVSCVARLVDTMRSKVAAIAAASNDLQNMGGHDGAGDDYGLVRTISSHAGELTRLLDNFGSASAGSGKSTESRSPAEFNHENRIEHLTPGKNGERRKDSSCPQS